MSRLEEIESEPDMKVYEEEPPWSVMGWAGQGGMCPHSALDDTDNRWGDWRPSWRCVGPDTGEIRRDCLESRDTEEMGGTGGSGNNKTIQNDHYIAVQC